MTKKQKLIGGISLLFVAGVVAVLLLTPTVPSFLRVIYPNFSIEALPGNRHYTFGESEFYAKEIVTGGKLLYVIAHLGRGSGADYEFYSEDGELLTQIVSFTFPQNDKEAFEEILQEGDIDADGEPELLILTSEFDDRSNAYDILKWVDGTLKPLSHGGERGAGVEFDEIGFENGYLWMTWHDPGARTGGVRSGIGWYTLSGNLLTMRKGLYTEPVSKDSKACHIYEINPHSVGWEIPATEENCESFGTRFEKYWTPTADPKIEAGQALRYKLPVDDRAIEAMVASLYDLTLFYTSYNDASIFDTSENPFSFFEPYYDVEGSWEDVVRWGHEVFRLAFVAKDSPAWSHEFMYPNGPGGDANIVGSKQVDENTVIAYVSWVGQEHLGPSPFDCKESRTNIDRLTFKKINGEWWLWNMEETVDHWDTEQRVADDQPCVVLNQDKFEKYKTGNF